MDWQGLLKWSIAQSDGTSSKDIKPMDDETKKWLREAFEHYSFDEVKRMGEIVQEIMKPETQTKEDSDKRIFLLDELEEIIGGLDRGIDFCKIGGMSALMKYIFDTTYTEVKILTLLILTGANQNNTQVQEYCAKIGAFKLMDLLQDQNLNIKVKEQIVSAISSLVRGENLSNKRIFIDRNGIELMFNLVLSQKDSIRIIEKVVNLFKDLVLYDLDLHKTHNDISEQSNTNAAFNKINLKNEEVKDKTVNVNISLQSVNELPQNAKYKNIVGTVLSQIGLLKVGFAQFMLLNIQDRYLESRISYLEITATLLNRNKDNLSLELKEYISTHYQLINKKNEVDNEHSLEIEYCQQILQL